MPSNNETEFRAILELQQELDAKLDEFINQVKALKARLGNGHLIADLDGEIYELRKVSSTLRQSLQVASTEVFSTITGWSASGNR